MWKAGLGSTNHANSLGKASVSLQGAHMGTDSSIGTRELAPAISKSQRGLTAGGCDLAALPEATGGNSLVLKGIWAAQHSIHYRPRYSCFLWIASIKPTLQSTVWRWLIWIITLQVKMDLKIGGIAFSLLCCLLLLWDLGLQLWESFSWVNSMSRGPQRLGGIQNRWIHDWQKIPLVKRRTRKSIHTNCLD